ncbi:hypothetical protein GE061_008114 [Apolygus lucorum]|uniref:Uncharacterized protein n=1 Tax=Apolygus lucorum TaxID=248454 RepID=A0A6A4II40_APOLU|nr:hypothetical protein GE061_008114 [Apolygus lucorum]
MYSYRVNCEIQSIEYIEKMVKELEEECGRKSCDTTTPEFEIGYKRVFLEKKKADLKRRREELKFNMMIEELDSNAALLRKGLEEENINSEFEDWLCEEVLSTLFEESENHDPETNCLSQRNSNDSEERRTLVSDETEFFEEAGITNQVTNKHKQKHIVWKRKKEQLKKSE